MKVRPQDILILTREVDDIHRRILDKQILDTTGDLHSSGHRNEG